MKKKVARVKAKSPKRDQYTVVLESIRDNFRAFGEGLSGLGAKVEKGFSEVNKKLDSHTEMIGQLMVDVAEIKHELKQKVGRDEFARLEKRVLMLERSRN